MSALPGGVRVRAVDWRTLDDESLTRCHELETVLGAELWPDQKPEPVEWFIRDARQTPAFVTLHTWLAENDAGDVVGIAHSEHAGASHDQRSHWVEVRVRPDSRRRGIGAHLLALGVDDAAAQGRAFLMSGTTDTCQAGDAFARRFALEPKLVERESELLLDNVDWAMVDRWVEEGPARAPGYELEFTDGALDGTYHRDLAKFWSIMETAPRDDLEYEDWKEDLDEIRQREERLRNTPYQHRWMYFARVKATGECVGGTNVFFRDHDRERINQGGTCVHPDHRGHAIGKWVKAAMLQRIRREMPHVVRVVTDNAYSNDPMLGINNLLGFKVTRSQTEWQAPIDAVQAALALP